LLPLSLADRNIQVVSSKIQISLETLDVFVLRKGKYHCQVCQCSCSNIAAWHDHIKGKRHWRNIMGQNSTAVNIPPTSFTSPDKGDQLSIPLELSPKASHSNQWAQELPIDKTSDANNQPLPQRKSIFERLKLRDQTDAQTQSIKDNAPQSIGVLDPLSSKEQESTNAQTSGAELQQSGASADQDVTQVKPTVQIKPNFATPVPQDTAPTTPQKPLTPPAPPVLASEPSVLKTEALKHTPPTSMFRQKIQQILPSYRSNNRHSTKPSELLNSNELSQNTGIETMDSIEQQSNAPTNCLKVENIAIPSTLPIHLQCIFSKYGKVVNTIMLYGEDPCRYSLVEFETVEQAIEAKKSVEAKLRWQMSFVQHIVPQ